MPTQIRAPLPSKDGHKTQTHGHSIGIPKNVVDNLPKGGGAGPHESQPQGHSLGIPSKGTSTKSTGATSSSNGPGIFKASSSTVLRNSGVAGAHRVGCRKK